MTAGLHCFRETEQVTESKVGNIGDCPEDEDQDHNCHIRGYKKVKQQARCSKI
jgi:hypothetical protein